MNILCAFLTLFSFLISYSATKPPERIVVFDDTGTMHHALIDSEEIVAPPFKKAKVYPQDFSPYGLMLEYKSIAKKNPVQEQVFDYDPITKKTGWMNKKISAANPMSDTITHVSRYAPDKLIKHTATTQIQPNWQEKTFRKMLIEKTVVEGPANKIPAEFYQMHNAIKKQVKKPTSQLMGVDRFVEHISTPAKLTFSVNDKKFRCTLVENTETKGTLREARPSESEPTTSTPLLQDFVAKPAQAKTPTTPRSPSAIEMANQEEKIKGAL